MILAPNATAATDTSSPNVWSDNPTTISNLSCKSGIVFKFISSNGAGYEEVHFNKEILLFPTFKQVSTASSISSKEAMPVEIIIGFPFDATYYINGISVISKDAILYAGTSISSRKSTDVLSKGEENTIKPKSSATFLSLGCHSQGMYASSYNS